LLSMSLVPGQSLTLSQLGFHSSLEAETGSARKDSAREECAQKITREKLAGDPVREVCGLRRGSGIMDWEEYLVPMELCHL
jgi:hypothetical protein